MVRSRCSPCPRGPPCRCEANCRPAPGYSTCDRACCGGAWRPRTGLCLCSARWACLARPGTVVLVAAAPSTVLEVNGGRAIVRDRVSFGGQVSTVVETRREVQPRPPGEPQTVGRSSHRVLRADRPSDTRRCTGRVAAGGEPRRRTRASRRAERQRGRRAGNEADVEVVGDPELTRAVRLALFHLMGSVADGGEAAVGRGA